MKRLLLICFGLPIGAFAWSFSGTTYTTDGTLSDVNGAFADAAANHSSIAVTVNMPDNHASPVTWGTGGTSLSIPSGVHAGSVLSGAGTPNTTWGKTLAAKGSGTVLTIIQAAAGCGSPLIYNQAGAALKLFEIKGPSSGSPVIIKNDTTDGFDETDLFYYATGGGGTPDGYFILSNACYGHIAHFTIDNTGGSGNQQFIQNNGKTDAWSNAVTPSAGAGTAGGWGNLGVVNGIPQSVVVENGKMIGPGKSMVEQDDYGRSTVRFCDLGGGNNIDAHGIWSDGTRGSRLMEAYDNEWSTTSGYYGLFNARGGTFLFFENDSAMPSSFYNWFGWYEEAGNDNPTSHYYITISSIAVVSSQFVVTCATSHRLPPSKTIDNIMLSCSSGSINPTLTSDLTGTRLPVYEVVTDASDNTKFTVTKVSTDGVTYNTLTAVHSGGAGTVTYWQTPYQQPEPDGHGRGPDIGGVPFTGTANLEPGYMWGNTNTVGTPWTLAWSGSMAQSQLIYYQETGSGTSSASFTMAGPSGLPPSLPTFPTLDASWFTDLTVSGSFDGSTGVGILSHSAMMAITPSKDKVAVAVLEGSWDSTRTAGTSPVLYVWHASTSKWGIGATSGQTPDYVPFQYPYSQSGTPPVVTSPSTVSVTVNNAINYTITATNSPTSFNASSLPSWASVNTSTGAITGTPTTTTGSPFSSTVSATNGDGTGSQGLTITVNASTVVPFKAAAKTSNSAVGGVLVH